MMNDEWGSEYARIFIIHHSAFITFFLLRSQTPAPQDFGDAPRLRDAAARRERLDGVEDLADRADARLVQVRDEAFQKLARARAVFRVDFEPRVNERADEPGPDRALVVGGVARLQVAVVGRLELRVVGRERAQADGRQELLPRDFEHRLPALAFEHRVFERDGEELVGPAGRVVPALLLPALDHVVEVAATLVPEALVEGAAAALGVRAEFLRRLLAAGLARPAFEQAERVVPERVDLDGLAAPRRHDPAVALRVHPRQLIAFRALHEQTVPRVDVDAEASPFEVTLYDVVHL